MGISKFKHIYEAELQLSTRFPFHCQDRFCVCIFTGFPEDEVTFECIFTGFAEIRLWECRVFSFKIARALQKSRVFPGKGSGPGFSFSCRPSALTAP